MPDSALNETWLSEVRDHVSKVAPGMLDLLDIYIGEASFGRLYISGDLARLGRGAAILEVGAGSLLLSCQLMREGFDVTALEPIGGGFSHFDLLRRLILEKAESTGCMPKMLNMRAEDLKLEDEFDYAFSVNVMEHVCDVRAVIENVMTSLRVGSSYRFTCPNYTFPYEPHFDIPSFVSKNITGVLFRNKIRLASSSVPDPRGTWESLNWITSRQVSNIAKELPGMNAKFNPRFLAATLERVTSDKKFALRRSKFIRLVITGLVSARLHLLTLLVPVSIQPAIDCTITRGKVRGTSY